VVDNAHIADFSESDMSTIRFAKPDAAAMASSALSSFSCHRFLIRSAAIAAADCCQSRQEVLGVRAGQHFNALLPKSREIPS
jgi:hypothetical protein